MKENGMSSCIDNTETVIYLTCLMHLCWLTNTRRHCLLIHRVFSSRVRSIIACCTGFPSHKCSQLLYPALAHLTLLHLHRRYLNQQPDPSWLLPSPALYAPGQLSKSNYGKIPISFNGAARDAATQRYQNAAGEMWRAFR